MPSLAQNIKTRLITTTALSAVALATTVSPAFAATHHKNPKAHRATVCANATTPASGASRPAIKAAVVCLINQQRTTRGLPALKEDPRLDRSAQGWTQTMVSTDQFTHGSDFAARITAVGYTWGTAGENIATGFATPQEVVEGWMGSPGHCRNILDPQYESVGTGVVNSAIQPFSTGPSTWTQDFATPLGAPAPSNNWGPADSTC
jgi:uncharacterized protein YkwD